MTAIVLRTDETVVFLVILVSKTFLPRLIMTINPLGEMVTDIINLAGCKLHLLVVWTIDRVTIRLIAYHMLDIGNGIVKGITQQFQTVNGLTRLCYNGILTGNLDLIIRWLLRVNNKFVKLWGIVNLDVGTEEIAGKLREISSRHPTLTEIEVKILKRYGSRDDVLQSSERTLQLSHLLLGARLPACKAVVLLNNIACKKLVGNLIASFKRIIIDTVAKLFLQVINGDFTDT